MFSYAAVYCDLFDTLIDFDVRRLPEIVVNGVKANSTSGAVYGLFSSFYPQIPFDQFHSVFIESYREVERQRSSTLMESSSQARFEALFTMLNIPTNSHTQELIHNIVDLHMETMIHAMEFPPGNLPVLQALKAKAPLGLISNFDHSPTAIRILQRHGIHDLFDVILISEAVGWRKPSPLIFLRAIESLDIDASRAIFIGDSPTLDVTGAKGVGMKVVWINRKGESYPAGIPKPDFEIPHFSRLLDVL